MTDKLTAAEHYRIEAEHARRIHHWDRLVVALRRARAVANDGALPAAIACREIVDIVNHTLNETKEE